MSQENILSSALFPFLEQIYYNNRKTRNRNTLKVYYKSINMALADVPIAIRNKCNLTLLYIIGELDALPRTVHYSKAIQIELSYTNSTGLTDIISKDKHIYMEVIRILKEKSFIIKVKGSTFLVNPYYIDNLTKDHWNELRLNVSQYEMYRQGSMQPPQPPLPPAP